MTPNPQKDRFEEILDGVYRHGVREGRSPGSRSNLLVLPADEISIATGLKELCSVIAAKDQLYLDACHGRAYLEEKLMEKDKQIGELKAKIEAYEKVREAK